MFNLKYLANKLLTTTIHWKLFFKLSLSFMVWYILVGSGLDIFYIRLGLLIIVSLIFAALKASSATIKQCSFTGGKDRCCAMWLQSKLPDWVFFRNKTVKNLSINIKSQRYILHWTLWIYINIYHHHISLE